MTVDFEKLGLFYLGRVVDPLTRQVTAEPLLYDSKDLTTHAVCVGMTGSGKTGLCLSLLEEAAIDGVPAIAIDPKGDLGNLLLTFPKLEPSDFRPWIDEGEAARAGLSPDELAAKTAEKWRTGLADWGQDGARIQRLRDAADVAVYTPGSSAGLPLSVLRSFGAPSQALIGDEDSLRERVSAATSGLLGLVGVESDPLTSREHVLVARIVDGAWREGRGLDLAEIVREIRTPPFQSVGVVDLESFFPAAERYELAMRVNALLASPSFGAWLEGEPLDVQRLLWTPEGRPRVSIVSIAHLSDPERMFLVTLLLSEIVLWMRAQPGTASLRAVVYMDEVFGFLPPVAAPPSKAPMLTLLKQGRASGLGVVLATQNPVDVDYKALSNAGTWLIGRLQTERDVLRVMDGLEGASTAAGRPFDRAAMTALIGGLAQRTFLMNDVHEDAPVVFQSRWALSYLRGPLTRAQIQSLMAPRKGRGPAAAPRSATSEMAFAGARPVLPPGIAETFVQCAAAVGPCAYLPRVLARAKLHHASAKDGVDLWRDVALLVPLDEAGGVAWDEASAVEAGALVTAPEPVAGATFGPLPATIAKVLAAAGKELSSHLVRTSPLVVLRCAALDEVSTGGETEGDFRARLAHASREARDRAVEKAREDSAPKVARLEERIRSAEARVAREKEQYSQARSGAAISFGATVLGALLGRRRGMMGTIGRATTAVRGASRAAGQKDDVAVAEDGVEALRRQLEELESDVAASVTEIEARLDPSRVVLDRVEIPPRKGDVTVTSVTIAWVPAGG